jgi:hypothetical protein
VSEQPEGGVFGNLPRSRPGTRSPLREGEHVAQQRETAPKAEPTDETLSATAGQQEAPSEPDQPSEADPGSEQQETAGLEDLAWAGIAAAAEAATIGVRLASRAMEAVRDAGKRT